jgi:hypothetical protein
MVRHFMRHPVYLNLYLWLHIKWNDILIPMTCLQITARPCLCTICKIFTYKDIRNFNHAQCNSLMMDTQYPKHVGEEK